MVMPTLLLDSGSVLKLTELYFLLNGKMVYQKISTRIK